MNDESPLTDGERAEPREPASGERADHQPSPPGTVIPGTSGAAQDREADEEPRADEPDPGEHPMP